MSFGNRNKKIKHFFEKIFDDDYELNAYHADRILKCLEDASIYGPQNKLLDSPFFSDIILKSYNSPRRKRNSVEIFVGKILTIMFKNELHFNKLTVMVSVNRLRMFMCKPNTCAPNSDVVLVFTNVAASLITHYSGISWLVENKIWQYVLCKCTHTRPVEVSRAAYNFIAQLAWKINELEDDAKLVEIFEYIINPIINNRYHTTNHITDGAEKPIYAPMMSSLNALLAVLTDTADIVKNNKMVPLLMKQFNLKVHMQIVLDVTRDSELASVLCELLFKLYAAAAKDDYYKYKKTECEIMNEVTSIYNNVICKLIMKQMSEAVADYVVKCNLFLAKVCSLTKPITFERDGKRFDFNNQFICHLVVPLWTYYSLNCGSDKKLDAITNYSFKMLNVTTEHIAMSATLFQTVVENHSCDVKKITIYTVKNLFQFKGQLTEAQAGILYQGLFYVLKTFIMSDDVEANLILNDTPLKTPDDIKLLILVLDAIKLLLMEHHISWYENLEIISLQETLINLLKQKCLCTKTLVKTLDLIDIGIKKFLSPDMTLLVENNNESSLAEIGAIAKEYIQHPDWEVRESTLSLLLSCTQLSFVKYIPFRTLISENKLMVLVACCALSDPEVYAQATALRCLASATKIDTIWRDVTIEHPNLHIRLVNMVLRHQEDVIRKEAVHVLTEIYVNQNVTCEYRNKMYSVMADVVLKDLNWEIQVAALNFWRQAMIQIGSDRGVIDGKFPSVTFSKEKRKIIIFNDDEIKKQLNNIMNDLSNIGCLNVLCQCLDSEQNVAVMGEAYKIVTEIKVVLDHYNFNVLNTSRSSSKRTMNLVHKNQFANAVRMDVTMDAEDIFLQYDDLFNFRDVIIDQILDTPQNELIMEIINNSSEQEEKSQDELVTEIHTTELIQPYDFWQKFLSTDYATIIQDKKIWISGHTSLDDLIDEILCTENTVEYDNIDVCDM